MKGLEAKMFKNLPDQNTNWQEFFFKHKITQYEKLLKTKKEIYWLKLGEQKAINLFNIASKFIPAYKDFLKKNGYSNIQVKTINDFKKLPILDKKNYTQAYPLNLRTWPEKIYSSKIFASSSGTTGYPNYWPRNTFQEIEAAISHELIYKNRFLIDRKKSLIIVGFPMGVYVSGMATFLPSWLLAQKYKNLSILSPGNNKAEVLKSVKNLSKNFEQTILIGHPFFIKDIIETGIAEGLNWSKLNIKMLFCSEGFSEEWRDYIIKKVGLGNNIPSAYSVYGSSEMLLMAYETPLTVASRKLLEKNPKINLEYFNSNTTPSLFQYNPALRYIESINKELIFTSFGQVPLIRYNLHDSGEIFSKNKFELLTKTKADWNLPFVSLSGRSDHTLIFYAANIYPEHIHISLNKTKFLKRITGKFSMKKGELKNKDEFLEIHIELRNNVKIHKNERKIFQSSIVSTLKKINLEYEFLWNNLDKNIIPKIKFWPYQHKKFFTPGLKPKYIV